MGLSIYKIIHIYIYTSINTYIYIHIYTSSCGIITRDVTNVTETMSYPPVVKHGLLENTLLIGDVPSKKPPFSSGMFQIVVFDYQRVNQA